MPGKERNMDDMNETNKDGVEVLRSKEAKQ